MTSLARAALCIGLSLIAICAVLACPFWVTVAQASHHHCCPRSGNTGDRCPLTICELSSPYMTEGKFDAGVAPAIADVIEALPIPPMQLLASAHPVELEPFPASPPDLPILLRVILI